MKIKKFIISNIILSILLISILYGLSWFYINYVNDRTVKFMEYNKLPANSIDIVTLGSSHGKYGIKFDKENQMNLALEQQGFYYGLKLLEKYEPKLKKGTIIIIPISIFNFYETNDFSKDETYKNYINLLEKKAIMKELKNSEYFFTKNFSIAYPPARIIETIAYLLKETIKKNYICYDDNIRGEKLTRAAIKTAVGHTQNLKLEKKLVKEYQENAMKSLNSILEICKTKKYKPIFIITPYWHEYIDELRKIKNNIFEDEIYIKIREVEKKQKKEYIFLDYSNDKRFKNNVEFFMDDDHLNEKGAEYFTNILLKDIEKEIKNERKI